MRHSRLLKWGLLAAGAAVGLAAVRRSRQTRVDFSGKVVLITGGSRGLGLVLARKLGRLGARIVICSRHAEQLQRAESELRDARIPVLAFVCDVTDVAAVKSMVRNVKTQWTQVDILINNAGMIQMGPIDSLTQQDFESALNTHLWGPLNVMREVLPAMRERRQGCVVNIASIGGKISIPHLIPYCASKFALVGLSRGVSAELAKQGIVVTTVVPGLMRTGSHHNALFKGRHREEFTWFSIANAMPFLSTSAEQAAETIIDGIRYGKTEVTIGYMAQLAIAADALVPELMTWTNGLVNRILPQNGGIGTRVARGADSHTQLSPSPFTAMSDRATLANNELD